MAVPELKYLNLKPFGGLCGRGGAVRLFFLRTGIEFKDELVEFSDWVGGIKQQCVESGLSPAGYLPIVTIDGDKHLTECIAIMRRFSRTVGEYGTSLEQDYLVDRTADVSVKWRDTVIAAILDPSKKEDYVAARPQFFSLFEGYLKSMKAEGSHVVGNSPTFADDLVFGILWDDEIAFGADELPKYPLLQAFYTAYLENKAVKEWCTAAKA